MSRRRHAGNRLQSPPGRPIESHVPQNEYCQQKAAGLGRAADAFRIHDLALQ
jgi:hypothetical protein